MSGKWRVLIVLCSLVSVQFCLGQEMQTECADSKCIQVGSYNLELFGSGRKPYGGVNRGPRSNDEIDRIAACISTELDLEIVVFQEINTASDEWTTLKQKLASHGYKFHEGTTSDRHQFVVLAWDEDDVSLVDNSVSELDVRTSFNLPGGCREDGLRKPVAGRFKAGEFDFWVIGVHLKSRTGTESCTKAIRTEQTRDLVKQVEQLESESGESDFLIVGDCNERYDHASFKPLTEAGFISQMRFLAEGSAAGSYIKTGSLNHSDDLIDHIWLRYGRTQELVRRSATVMSLPSAESAKKHIIEQSDHVPVWMSFRTDEDLDEED